MKSSIAQAIALPGAGAEKTNSALAPGERDRWLESMADLASDNDAEHRVLKARIQRLESRARLISMTEEMKTFLVMTGISLACAVFVPLIQGAIEKWRRSS